MIRYSLPMVTTFEKPQVLELITEMPAEPDCAISATGPLRTREVMPPV